MNFLKRCKRKCISVRKNLCLFMNTYKCMYVHIQGVPLDKIYKLQSSSMRVKLKRRNKQVFLMIITAEA